MARYCDECLTRFTCEHYGMCLEGRVNDDPPRSYPDLLPAPEKGKKEKPIPRWRRP